VYLAQRPLKSASPIPVTAPLCGIQSTFDLRKAETSGGGEAAVVIVGLGLEREHHLGTDIWWRLACLMPRENGLRAPSAIRSAHDLYVIKPQNFRHQSIAKVSSLCRAAEASARHPNGGI